MTEPLLIAAVGDVFLNRPDGASAFAPVQHVLDAADLLFATSEGVYTDRDEVAPSCGIPVVSPAANLAHLRPAGFDVMTMANNHSVDAGHAAMLENIAALRGLGIPVIGAGADVAQARAPAFLTQAGRRVAFLAFSAIFRPGYEAKRNRPGISTLRVHTQFYYPDWDPIGILEPGSAPHIRTFPYPEDAALLAECVAAAKREADIVVVALHAGSTRPAFLQDYERAFPAIAIDAGADMVFANHHHFLQGCETVRTKPVFYGLGHFTFDLVGLEERLGPKLIAEMKTQGPYAIYPREGYPLLPFHEECRMTMVAFCRVAAGAVESCLLPCAINPANQPVPCGVDTTEGRAIAEYIIGISRSVGLATAFSFEGPVIAGHRCLGFA